MTNGVTFHKKAAGKTAFFCRTAVELSSAPVLSMTTTALKFASGMFGNLPRLRRNGTTMKIESAFAAARRPVMCAPFSGLNVCKKRSNFFELFLYVSPEPILVNQSNKIEEKRERQRKRATMFLTSPAVPKSSSESRAIWAPSALASLSSAVSAVRLLLCRPTAT